MGSDYMDNNEIECIMKMLDWNSSKEIQQKGRKKAEKIKDLNMFIQPADKKYNKNVWENCAIILQDKSDEELGPYLERILEWLQDMNWPGAELILERMLCYKDKKTILKEVKRSIEKATKGKDIVWEETLKKLVKQIAY